MFELLEIRRQDVTLTGDQRSVVHRCGTHTYPKGAAPYRKDHPKTATSDRFVTGLLPQPDNGVGRRLAAVGRDELGDKIVFLGLDLPGPGRELIDQGLRETARRLSA